MNDKVGISVITVVRDGVLHLEGTITSVIKNKARSKIEYIVIDGGSTDGSLDIVKKYADHISYWESEPDSGIYDAMNKGWNAAADRNFVLFLGSGDRLISLPDSIWSYDCNDVLYGDVLMGEKRVFNARADYHLKLYNSLHHQALLVNKAIHPGPPFNQNYRVYADFDFNQRLMKKGVRFVYLPQFVTYAYPGGVSDKQDFSESLRIIRNNFGLFWMLLALAGKSAMNIFPLLKRLRPFREV